MKRGAPLVAFESRAWLGVWALVGMRWTAQVPESTRLDPECVGAEHRACVRDGGHFG
jgi:hypothetical protein